MGLGAEVEEHRHDVGSGDAVDQTVMGLRDEGETVIAEPLRHPDLPQRLRPVELLRHDPGRESFQLAVVARRGQGRVAHVVLEVEVGVVDPDRPAEAERDGGELLAEPRDLLESPLDHVFHVFVVGRRPLEDGDTPHVHVGVRPLQVQEELV